MCASVHVHAKHSPALCITAHLRDMYATTKLWSEMNIEGPAHPHGQTPLLCVTYPCRATLVWEGSQDGTAMMVIEVCKETLARKDPLAGQDNAEKLESKALLASTVPLE